MESSNEQDLLPSEKYPKPVVKTWLERETLNVVVELRSRMAPADSLGLPPLLEAKRWKYAIPNGAFASECVYDRIYLWQIPINETECFGDTLIYMPETAKKRELESAPRGIIVSAGMLALDHLLSNGMMIGDTVGIICQAPFRREIETILGHKFYLIILRSGDICDDEDLRERTAKGKGHIEYRDGQHVYVDKEGQSWKPQLPWIGDGY